MLRKARGNINRDRNPDSPDDEKVRLSWLFAAVRDRYRLLAATRASIRRVLALAAYAATLVRC